mmetsp:Transcript_89522/g.158913  ORF Transcript_89522/g.158913 Transcript_89522/m.158913 type:complete len:87 (+) Transcript_89522:350-610(+)
MEDRRATATAWHKEWSDILVGLGDAPLAVPLLIDNIDCTVEKYFDALPERLYVLEDGAIVDRGGQGPFDYSVSALEAVLEQRFKAK